MPRKSTRNASGGGTIRQRADGRWEARITLGHDPGTGKQKQRSIYGATQKEVRQKMQKALVELDEGTYTAPAKMTVKQWMEVWLTEYTANVKPSTLTSYRQHTKNHICPALGAIRLDALTAPEVQRFCNDLQRVKGLAPKSIKNIHNVLHHALEQAVQEGHIRLNPAANRLLPRIEKADIQPLEIDEQRAFLSALPEGDVFSDVMRMAIFTGMRQGEILGLQWSRVDFEHGTILIDQQLHYPREKGDSYCLMSPKSGKPRTIQPAPSVMRLLDQRRRQQLADRLKVGSMWDDNGIPNLVFTNEFGKFLNFQSLERRYKAAISRAGIPAHRFHDLRHTFAVNSLRAGDDIKTVQENLGHYTAAFTLDQYGHVTNQMRAASSDRMQAFIEGLF